ncbi:MAG: hypothetical protein EZS28_045279 [Streblomastix strix]|uniref:Uncharacterized protein n=1 Tax=Streblomastix strix TaxID=222440 RepID=A0A5J4TLC3_9EUKA|nr:MAG: hypothetical protein EZS28_045279 [Streblomastix strix]
MLQDAQLEGIRELTDNTVAMFNLNKGRAALPLAGLVNSILLIAGQQGWKVEALHIPGIMNKEPDLLMKLKVEITMDAFAIHINRQHRKFCSITKHMGDGEGLIINHLGESNSNIASTNTPAFTHNYEGQGGPRQDSSDHSTQVARPILIYGTSRDYNIDYQTGLERIITDSGQQNEEETIVSPIKLNIHVQGFIQPSERLFRFLLEDYGLKQEVVQGIVESWHGQWRRHVSALKIVVKYLEQNNYQQKELRTLEQSSVFMANFLSDQMDNGASDNSFKSCRGALAVLQSFIGYKEEQVHSKLVAQLIKPVLMRTRHKDREIEQWDLNRLLEQITKEEVELLQSNLSLEEIMTISLTLCMTFTVARLAELFRATLINETEKEITLETVILKKLSRIIEQKIKNALDQRICSVYWLKA